MTRTLIVSTCGTSLLTNTAPPDLGDLIRARANDAGEGMSPGDRQRIDAHAEQRQAVLLAASPAQARNLAAELNGLVRFYDGRLERAAANEHVLLHTDTYQGERVAAILERWLRARGVAGVWPHRAAGLNLADPDGFMHALGGLVSWCEQTLPGYRHKGWRVAFNLVGGFKSVQGFMQTLGMFYADEIFYIFEAGDDLLRIPRLPIDFDAAAKAIVRRHPTLFRRLVHATPAAPAGDVEDVGQLPETFLYRLGDEVELSPWGRLVWERNKASLYRERLLDVPTPLIRFTPAFERAAADLTPDRVELVNQRLDDLARYLGSGRTDDLRRLDFKRLRGDPLPPSTHECDAWSDQAAWRIFGHFDGGTFVIDRLGPGLH